MRIARPPCCSSGRNSWRRCARSSRNCPSLRTVIATEGGAPEWQDYTAWRDAQSADDPKVAITRQDVAIQLYTSGTTGKPKGAMLSHANLLNLLETGEGEKPDWNKWTEDDVSLVAMPVFHIGGSGWGCSASITAPAA